MTAPPSKSRERSWLNRYCNGLDASETDIRPAVTAVGFPSAGRPARLKGLGRFGGEPWHYECH